MTSSGTEPALVGEAVRAVRRGQADAFGPIVRLYQRQVFGLALMFVREPAAAEEVAQDAFVRAFTHLEAYNAALPFYPWLATITVRLAQNRVARQRRLMARDAPPAAPEIQDPASGDALDKLISDEAARRLWQVVAELPAGERSAVVMHYRQDLGVREIARAMGVTAGTVKTFLFRARRKLRRLAETLQRKESA